MSKKNKKKTEITNVVINANNDTTINEVMNEPVEAAIANDNIENAEEQSVNENNASIHAPSVTDMTEVKGAVTISEGNEPDSEIISDSFQLCRSNPEQTIASEANDVYAETVIAEEAPTLEPNIAAVENEAVNEDATVTESNAKKAPKQAANAATPAKKRIQVTATCYHYYRNWLRDWLRPLAPSARFQKSPESYDGHITVLESEKEQAIAALELWKTENPDVKEMFWDIKK